jgi:hypothetical protein
LFPVIGNPCNARLGVLRISGFDQTLLDPRRSMD